MKNTGAVVGWLRRGECDEVGKTEKEEVEEHENSGSLQDEEQKTMGKWVENSERRGHEGGGGGG